MEERCWYKDWRGWRRGFLIDDHREVGGSLDREKDEKGCLTGERCTE